MKDLFSIICRRRGWTPQFLRAIEDTTHPLLDSVDRLTDELKSIHDAGEQLIVLPDFDMDGITSGVTGYAGFAELGFNVGLYRPDPSRGYGFGEWDVARIVEQYPDVAAIITCDVGITAYAGAGAAMDRGIKVLITDHHKELDEPEAKARYTAPVVKVDPMKLGETYPHGAICGAHVMYQVLHRYAERFDPAEVEWIDKLRLFAGVGTVSDMMPLLYENRQLVRDSVSLARLAYAPTETDDEGDEIVSVDGVPVSTLVTMVRGRNPAYVAAFEGLSRILTKFHHRGKLRSIDDVSESFYGFYLSPTFNACKRMDGDMNEAFGAFFDFAERRDAHIDYVLDLNEKRKEAVEAYVAEIEGREQPWAPYVYLSSAPGGLLGLIANRFMSETGLPTCVLHDPGSELSEYRGSGRSPSWFLFNSLVNASPIRTRVAGHEGAFGVMVRDGSALEELHDFIETEVDLHIARLGVDPQAAAAPEADLLIGERSIDDVSSSDLESLKYLVSRIERMHPYGVDFREPDVQLTMRVGDLDLRTMGRPEPKHVKLTTPSGMECLWWNSVPRMHLVTEASDDAVITIHGQLEVSTFRGQERLSLIVKTLVVDDPFEDAVPDADALIAA